MDDFSDLNTLQTALQDPKPTLRDAIPAIIFLALLSAWFGSFLVMVTSGTDWVIVATITSIPLLAIFLPFLVDGDKAQLRDWFPNLLACFRRRIRIDIPRFSMPTIIFAKLTKSWDEVIDHLSNKES